MCASSVEVKAYLSPTDTIFLRFALIISLITKKRHYAVDLTELF